MIVEALIGVAMIVEALIVVAMLAESVIGVDAAVRSVRAVSGLGGRSFSRRSWTLRRLYSRR